MFACRLGMILLDIGFSNFQIIDGGLDQYVKDEGILERNMKNSPVGISFLSGKYGD